MKLKETIPDIKGLLEGTPPDYSIEIWDKAYGVFDSIRAEYLDLYGELETEGHGKHKFSDKTFVIYIPRDEFKHLQELKQSYFKCVRDVIVAEESYITEKTPIELGDDCLIYYAGTIDTIEEYGDIKIKTYAVGTDGEDWVSITVQDDELEKLKK